MNPRYLDFFDRAFFRVLLVTAPFSCGSKTVYEPPAAPACASSRTVDYDWTSASSDGGTSDGGTSDGGSGTSDGGTSASPIFGDAWCASVCQDTLRCEPTQNGQGRPAVRCIGECSYAVGCGRRPAQLTECPSTVDDIPLRYLEQAAYLEAASVHAFTQLARELDVHGAPADLVDAALRAAEEEIQHAHDMNDLVAAYGGTPQVVAAQPTAVRSLVDIALENVVEGCVRETYGALVAWHQATHAQDAALRVTMSRIAQEETGHARLSFAVDRWLQSRLTDADWQRTRRAKQQAIEQLGQALDPSPAEALKHRVGLPSRDQAQAWLQAAQHELWQEGELAGPNVPA